MRIILTLTEVLEKCNDWPEFCEKYGYQQFVIAEGGGDIEVTLSQQQAEEYGIIARKTDA